MWGYSALLGAGLILSAPWWMLRMITTERYRDGLRQRLGGVPRTLLAAAAGKRVIWLHAVSVGEVLAAARLGKELEATLNEGLIEEAESSPWRVMVSTTTRTGQMMARDRFGADRVFYFPLDFAFAMQAFLRALRPELLVLVESELWPRLLHECEAAGVPVAVVNARVSDRSLRRGRLFAGIWSQVLRKVTLWLAQSEADAERLKELGARPEAVAVAGNLKYDWRALGETPMSRRLAPLLSGSRVVLAGSTLEDEEAQFLAVWSALQRAVPVAVLLLAPRHPDRFERVWSAMRASGFPAFRCSQLMNAPGPLPPGSLLLLDTIGDLAAMYALADIAFVGGSLVQKGGHNPLEPARFGIPVIMGPSFENFRGVVDAMQAGEGLRILRGRGELLPAMLQLLEYPEVARAMGARGQGIFEREGGATARSIDALIAMLHGFTKAENPQEAVTI